MHIRHKILLTVATLILVFIMANRIIDWCGNKSFSSQLRIVKDGLEYAKTHNLNERVVVFVNFSKHSGKPRFFVYDYRESKVVYSSLCAHGRGKGNKAWKAKLSNEVGSKCSCKGHFKITGKKKIWGYLPCLILDGLDASCSNARRRGILVHPSMLVSVFQYGIWPFYIPLGPESEGCFAISYNAYRKLERMYCKGNKPIMIYAYE